MVIDPNNISPARVGDSQRNSSNNSVQNTESSSVVDDRSATGNNAARDTVELSTAAQDLGRIRESLNNVPDVDETRVNAVRQQIADGSYTIDAEQIAQSIIDSDQNFLV